MKKIITIILLMYLLIITNTNLKSVTTLSAGDIAIIAVNTNLNKSTNIPQDEFIILLLKDLEENTVVKFTDCGYINGELHSVVANGYGSTETEMVWTVPSGGLSAGTQVKFWQSINVNPPAISYVESGKGTVSGGGLSLTVSGDQIIVYQGLRTSPTFITAVHNEVGANTDTINWDNVSTVGPNASNLPTGLTDGTNALWLRDPNGSTNTLKERDNWYIKCSVDLTISASNTISQIRSNIMNINNWDFKDGTGDPTGNLFEIPRTDCVTNPTISSITNPSNQTYKENENINFTMNWSSAVTISGSPRIALNIGGTTKYATYFSGSGSTATVFRYTVENGLNDNDGIAVTSASVDLNGGTIKDGSNNDATLTLGSISSLANVKVDALEPSVSSINISGTSPSNLTSLQFSVSFNESVTGVDVGDFSLTTSGTSGTISGISGSGTTYTVTVSSITGDGTIRLDLKSSGTGIQDAYSNPIGSGFTSGQSYTIDNTAPIVNSVSVPAADTYIFDENLDFTVHYSEAVTVVGSPYITITLNSGSVNATYLSGSGSANLLFRYVVSNNDNDKDGISVTSFNLNSATIKDAVNNNANNTLNSVASTSLVFVDALAPHVTSVAMPSNGTYGTGQTLNLTVNFDEAVNIVGSPYITVNVGGSNKNATYSSGTGTSAIVFSYTVVTNDIDVDGVVVSGSINLNSGSVKDLATNNATLTLNSIGSGASVFVDGVGPTITSVSKPIDGTYITDQNLDFTVNFNENTVATGFPRILITIGSTAKYASYVSGSGTSNLLFRYTIESGLIDNNGIVISSPIELNGGTLKDQYNNSATLTFTSPNTDGILVDASTPTITLGSVSSRTVNSIAVTSNNVTASSSTVSEKGIVYGTSINPTISGSKVANATAGLGTYDITLSSLNPETLYYIRAYATNTAGTGYSSETSAYTLSTEPTGHSSLTASAGQTNIVLNFQAASTFGADGYILLRKQSVTYPDATNVNDGSAPVDLSLPNGTVLAATITSNSQTSFDDTGLTPANSLFSYVLIPFNWDASHTATYNYRTSATIPTASATTGIPVVSTGTKTNFGTTSITITGSNVISEGGANVTDRGVVWSTSPNPTIANNKVATSPNPSSGTGTYDVNIAGLTAGTKYYARAYATSSIATSYGSEITFYTAPNTQASNITWGSVTRTSITANWTNGSGANRLVLVKKGSPISNTPLTNESVYTANSILGSGSAVDGGSVVYHSTGNSVTVTGLTNNTLYYFRVFESVGSGSEVVFNQNTATTNPTSRNTNRKTGAEGGDVFDFDIQTISPNPANDYIKIDFTLPEEIALNMQIFDLQGNTMFTLSDPNRFTRGHNQQTIDCSNFPSGTYFISMTNGSEAFYYSFVVER